MYCSVSPVYLEQGAAPVAFLAGKFFKVAIFITTYSKISIIRTMIIRISGLIQTLMNVWFLM